MVEKSRCPGTPQGQSFLDIMHHEGRGVAQDYDKSRYWLEKAPARGDADAMFVPGLFAEYAKGVRYDIATAKAWYDKACKRGLQESCDASARLIAEGGR